MSAGEPPPEGFGHRLARLRRARGWNQGQLGSRVGLGGAQISKYERGAYMPRPDVLGQLAEVLGTSIDFLVIGREPATKRDTRLRDLLPILEALPPEVRDQLVEALGSLVKAYHLLAQAGRGRSAG